MADGDGVVVQIITVLCNFATDHYRRGSGRAGARGDVEVCELVDTVMDRIVMYIERICYIGPTRPPIPAETERISGRRRRGDRIGYFNMS